MTTSVPAFGAVCCGEPNGAARPEVEDDEPDAECRRSSSAAWRRASSSWFRTSALMPRAPHLQSHASLAAGRLHGQVVRVDLGGDAVEQDPPLAADRPAAGGPRRRRRGPGSAPPRTPRGTGAGLSPRPATSRRRGEDAPRRARGPGASGPEDRREDRPPGPGSDDSPFMTARAMSRCGVRGVRERGRPGGRRAGRPGSPRRRRCGRPARRPGSASSALPGPGGGRPAAEPPASAAPRAPGPVAAAGRGRRQGQLDDGREGRQPVDRAVRVGDPGDLGAGGGDGGCRDPGRADAPGSGPAAAASRVRPASARAVTYVHSSSIVSPSSARAA